MPSTRTRSVERITSGLIARGLYDVLREISTRFHVPARDILGPCRYKSVAAARHVLFVELRRLGLSYPDIGRLLDRDHTTVLDACKRATDLPPGLAYVRRSPRPFGPRDLPRPIAKATLVVRVTETMCCEGCGAMYGDHRAAPPHAIPPFCGGFRRRNTYVPEPREAQEESA